MYKHHFALNRYPFEPSLPPDQLFQSQSQQEALMRLGQLRQARGGIGLLTGEPGCGKSTVCRQLFAGLHSGEYRPRYVSLTTGSILDLYQVIAQAFGVPPARHRAQAFLSLREEFSVQHREARQLSILVIDEAHYLRTEALEEMRLITNFQMDSEYRLCLILVGQTELRARLEMNVFESLRQRITARCHIGSLEAEEIPRYLEHRLRLAGAEIPLFPANAIEAIAQASNGVPRRIDRIAHLALSAAAIEQHDQVQLEDVQNAILDIQS